MARSMQCSRPATTTARSAAGIMAGGLAYRLFIVLPLALAAIAARRRFERRVHTPEKAAKSMGLAGLVSNSVAGAIHTVLLATILILRPETQSAVITRRFCTRG
jgi:hypothetical protein